MKVASVKAIISGIVALLGAGYAAIAGQAQVFFPVSLGLFVFMMLIQYGSIKFKIVTSFATLVGFYYFIFGGGTAP